jgi:hypothetical protein
MTLKQCFHLPHITAFNGPRCIFELRTNYNSYLPLPHIYCRCWCVTPLFSCKCRYVSPSSKLLTHAFMQLLCFKFKIIQHHSPNTNNFSFQITHFTINQWIKMPRPSSQTLTSYYPNVSIFMLFLSERRKRKAWKPSSNIKLFLSQAPAHPPNGVYLIFIMTFPRIYNLPLFLKSLSTPLAPTASSQLVKLNFNRSDLISNVV